MSKVSGSQYKGWRAATRLVRGGTQRSGFDETSEGIFMTSGYVYDSAESAEAAFKGESARYIYSRYANPTVTMFEERLALLEGAELDVLLLAAIRKARAVVCGGADCQVVPCLRECVGHRVDERRPHKPRIWNEPKVPLPLDRHLL